MKEKGNFQVGPDLCPVSLAFSAVFNGKHFMGWLLPGFGVAGHDDVPFRCSTAHDARPCAVERDGPDKRRGQKAAAPCRNGVGVPCSVLTPARGLSLIRTEKGRAVQRLDVRKGIASGVATSRTARHKEAFATKDGVYREGKSARSGTRQEEGRGAIRARRNTGNGLQQGECRGRG